MVNKQDHDNIVSILTKMEYVKERLDAGTERMVRIENRLNELDSWRNKAAGIAIGTSAVITLLINWMFRRGG